MSSVYVVCWIFLQTFQTYFCIKANSVDPAVWSGPIPFAKRTLKIQKQTRNQTTIVVIGSLKG